MRMEFCRMFKKGISEGGWKAVACYIEAPQKRINRCLNESSLPERATEDCLRGHKTARDEDETKCGDVRKRS